jgi:hypothetical protein
MKKTYLVLPALIALLALSGCTAANSPSNSADNTAVTTGAPNTTATATVDGTGLLVSGSNKENGDSLSPYLIFTVPVGVTSSAPLASLRAENFQVNNLEAGGVCTTPNAADMTVSTSGMSPGMSFSFECTTTGAYNVNAIMNSQGKYDSTYNFKYAGLQPKDVNRTFSFDLVAVYPDGTIKRKTLTGSFDAAKLIEGVMQNGANLSGLGETM